MVTNVHYDDDGVDDDRSAVRLKGPVTPIRDLRVTDTDLNQVTNGYHT